MAKFCKGRRPAVFYGDWIEVYNLEKELVASFKITFDMCEEMLDRMILFKYDLKPNNYTVKKIKEI